jgi:hypothetical protein
MQIQAPDQVERPNLAETAVLVNIFNGNERSTVEMSFGDSGAWVPMELSPQVDPLYARVTERESGQGASVSSHMWEADLPADLPLGGHLIRIRTIDMYGAEYTGTRIVRVVEAGETEVDDETGVKGG